MPIVINVPNSGLCSVPYAGTTVSDCVHYTSVKRREWNCLYERRSVTALYSRSFHRSSQSDNTKTVHLAYTVDVSARSHKIAFRPASGTNEPISGHWFVGPRPLLQPQRRRCDARRGDARENIGTVRQQEMSRGGGRMSVRAVEP